MIKKLCTGLVLAVSLLPSLALAGGSSMAVEVISRRVFLAKPVQNKLLMSFNIDTYFPSKQDYPEIENEINQVDFLKVKLFCKGDNLVKRFYLYGPDGLIKTATPQYFHTKEALTYFGDLNLHLENNQEYNFSIRFDSFEKLGTRDALTCEILGFNEDGSINDLHHPTFWSPEYEKIIGDQYIFFDTGTKAKIYSRVK